LTPKDIFGQCLPNYEMGQEHEKAGKNSKIAMTKI